MVASHATSDQLLRSALCLCQVRRQLDSVPWRSRTAPTTLPSRVLTSGTYLKRELIDTTTRTQAQNQLPAPVACQTSIARCATVYAQTILANSTSLRMKVVATGNLAPHHVQGALRRSMGGHVCEASRMRHRGVAKKANEGC